MRTYFAIALLLLTLLAEDALGKDQMKCFQCQYVRMKRGPEAIVPAQCLEPDETDARIMRKCHGVCLKTYVNTDSIEYIERACVPRCRDGTRRLTDYGEGVNHCCEGDFCNHGNGIHASLLTVLISVGYVLLTKILL